MSNTRAARPRGKAGGQPDPGEVWELLRAAVAQASPPGPATGKTTDAGAGPGRARLRPGGIRLVWRAYHRLLAPFWWMAWVQAAAWAAWAARGLAGGQARALILTVAVAAAALQSARRAWWARNGDGTKGRPRRRRTARGAKIPPWALSRGYLAWCLAAGAAWTAGAALTFPGSGTAQLSWLTGGLVIAVPHLHRRRYRPVPRAELPPAPLADEARAEQEHPRLARFRDWFCRTGPLTDADLYGYAEIPDGFGFELVLAEGSKGTREDVVRLREAIAARHDVPLEQVTVEQSKIRRSHRRAAVTILETVNAFERVQPWDGTSTYDPATGAFDLGRYIDSAAAHWLLHKPGSGAAGGVLAGVIGSGKTGSAHCIACEAGQARLCAACGAQQTCARCDMRRICALWMGDPQMQPFGVWRGRADLMAWGPAACVRMLLIAHHAMRARAAYFGTMQWTDHLGRANTGKGWFDPSVLFPLIQILMDEWPLIAAHPELGKIAVPLAAAIAKEGRKVGIGLTFITQIPDLSELGERAVREMLKAFNVLAHRTDSLSKYMLGIEGDPTELPAGVHGLGYLNGMDRRPAATMRTKEMREYLQPGQTGIDVREIAERISREPVAYDQAVLDAIRPLGYEGPLQVLAGGTPADVAALAAQALRTATAGNDSGLAAPTVPSSSPVPSAPLLAGPASLDAVSRVARAIERAGGGGAELYDLMAGTGLDALQAQRAAASLVAAGHAAQQGDRFVPAARESR